MSVSGADERIAVIYVLSTGRSGSTLLDLLLGAHPEIWTLGEAQMLPWEVRECWRRCGCGTPVVQCPFWQHVLRQMSLDGHRYPIDHFRERRNRAKVLRWTLLPDLLRGSVGSRWRDAAQEYAERNQQYFRLVQATAAAHAKAPTRLLIDASKDPYRLLWLQASGRYRLRVVHLVRDPRAYVFSIIRDDLPHAWRKALVASARWIVENALFAHVLRAGFARGEHCFLRYEQLASAPGETLRALGGWLGCEFEADLPAGFREERSHGLAGSQTRWETSGISLDMRWRRDLPGSYAALVWAVTQPLARLWGYR